MEPRIQYAQTKDDVSIAFCSVGQGMPLVSLPLAFSHLQIEWGIPGYRRWYERLARNRELVRYDYRGSGLSERDVTDFSLDALLLDLEAVVDRLGLERFALFGVLHSTPLCVAYAARNPERVSHLLLFSAFARGSDVLQSPQIESLASLRDKDWQIYSETVAHTLAGWSEAEQARQMAEMIRESVTPTTTQAAMTAIGQMDVASVLGELRTPTLVLHRRHVPFPDMGLIRRLASQIPDARLALQEGTAIVPHVGDYEAVAQAIDEFLGEGEETGAGAELPEGMAVILFLDIADSVALTERLGDAAFRAKAGELDASLRAAIREAGGTPVEGKVLGDGVMAVFTSARQAIDCALRCKKAGDEGGLPLHLGIHAGDVIREGNTVHGGAVNIAQRITDASAPGEILVSDTLRGLARTSTDVSFEDRGERELKGIEEPQRLWVVVEQD